MKELTKDVKLIFIPCNQKDLKPEHWLLLNRKKKTLEVPVAGGQYRRMIQGGHIPVKPYLLCDDEITSKDVSNGNAQFDKERDAYYKVAATPEQIHGSKIIPFDDGIEYDLTANFMSIILRTNDGVCKIQSELVNGKVVIVI